MTTAREQTARLADLLRQEHFAMADFLVALADFDRRQLWAELGHASLFSFLRRELGLSAGAAQYRKTAAELVQRHPQVEAALREGKLCLSSVIEVAKVITPENAAELLPRFFGLSSRDAAFVAVSIRPVEDPPRRDLIVMPLRVATATASPSCDTSSTAAAPEDTGASALRAPETMDRGNASPEPPPGSAPVRNALAVEPLDSQRARVHMTVSRRLLRKLEEARAALSHSHPGAGTDEILEVGLDLILARHAKRRGLVEKPRKSPPKTAPSASREARGRRKRDHVPAHVMREVWKRDGGACAWPLDSGGVCGSTHQVELDHIQPVALGGPSTIGNCRLLCRYHQDLAARHVFGHEWMDQFSRRRQRPVPKSTDPAHGPRSP